MRVRDEVIADMCQAFQDQGKVCECVSVCVLCVCVCCVCIHTLAPHRTHNTHMRTLITHSLTHSHTFMCRRTSVSKRA